MMCEYTHIMQVSYAEISQNNDNGLVVRLDMSQAIEANPYDFNIQIADGQIVYVLNYIPNWEHYETTAIIAPGIYTMTILHIPLEGQTAVVPGPVNIYIYPDTASGTFSDGRYQFYLPYAEQFSLTTIELDGDNVTLTDGLYSGSGTHPTGQIILPLAAPDAADVVGPVIRNIDWKDLPLLSVTFDGLLYHISIAWTGDVPNAIFNTPQYITTDTNVTLDFTNTISRETLEGASLLRWVNEGGVESPPTDISEIYAETEISFQAAPSYVNGIVQVQLLASGLFEDWDLIDVTIDGSLELNNDGNGSFSLETELTPGLHDVAVSAGVSSIWVITLPLNESISVYAGEGKRSYPSGRFVLTIEGITDEVSVEFDGDAHILTEEYNKIIGTAVSLPDSFSINDVTYPIVWNYLPAPVVVREGDIYYVTIPDDLEAVTLLAGEESIIWNGSEYPVSSFGNAQTLQWVDSDGVVSLEAALEGQDTVPIPVIRQQDNTLVAFMGLIFVVGSVLLS